MSHDQIPRLSELLNAAGLDAPSGSVSTRREFLGRASVLSLVIPGVGAALTACSARDPVPGTGQQDQSRDERQANDELRTHNSDSRLDSSLLKGGKHGSTTRATGDAAKATFRRYDPVLPAPSPAGRIQLHWHARHEAVRISADTVVAGWTFEGDIPGPIVHCRVGDTVEFTLTNDVEVPHSMDFHAAQIDPKVAFRSVPK